MNIDLADLTRKALVEGGCRANLIKDLDNHSAIQLHLKNDLCINIDATNDGLALVSSQVLDGPLQVPAHAALPMLELLAKPARWSATGAMTLVDENSHQSLKALIGPTVLQNVSAYFQAVSEFYERVLEVRRFCLS
jgi:hypothetical protein